MREAKRANTQNLKEWCLDAAEALAAAEGWGAVSTRRLAAECGLDISTSEVQVYVGSGKQKIREACALRERERLRNHLLEATLTGHSTLRQIAAAFRGDARPEIVHARLSGLSDWTEAASFPALSDALTPHIPVRHHRLTVELWRCVLLYYSSLPDEWDEAEVMRVLVGVCEPFRKRPGSGDFLR
jgi:AcrR family transcriptional regulator